MNRKIILIIIIILLAIAIGAIGYFTFVKKSVPYASQTECVRKTGKQCYLFQGLCQVMEARNKSEEEANEKFLNDCLPKIGTWQPVEETSQTTGDMSNWKTYRNDKFGFEFKYPAELTAVSSGPSEEQKKLDRGEMISGTVPPSYDTITFSNQTNKEQFNVVIFPIREDGISPAGFKGYSDNGVIKSGYLSMGSACDTRWMDSISEEPTLVKKNGISVLEVQVIAGGPKEGVSNGCYYFKNSAGNLIVFNVAGIEQKADFLNIFHLVGDKIFSTLNLIK